MNSNQKQSSFWSSVYEDQDEIHQFPLQLSEVNALLCSHFNSSSSEKDSFPHTSQVPYHSYEFFQQSENVFWKLPTSTVNKSSNFRKRLPCFINITNKAQVNSATVSSQDGSPVHWTDPDVNEVKFHQQLIDFPSMMVKKLVPSNVDQSSHSTKSLAFSFNVTNQVQADSPMFSEAGSPEHWTASDVNLAKNIELLVDFLTKTKMIRSFNDPKANETKNLQQFIGFPIMTSEVGSSVCLVDPPTMTSQDGSPLHLIDPPTMISQDGSLLHLIDPPISSKTGSIHLIDPPTITSQTDSPLHLIDPPTMTSQDGSLLHLIDPPMSSKIGSIHSIDPATMTSQDDSLLHLIDPPTLTSQTGSPLHLIDPPITSQIGSTAHLIGPNVNQAKNPKLLVGSVVTPLVDSLNSLSNSYVNQVTNFQPRVQFKSHLYKTELCKYFLAGQCMLGDKCQFAHGRNDLRNVAKHPKYRTKVCVNFLKFGYCFYADRCMFIHLTNATFSQSDDLGSDGERSPRSISRSSQENREPFC